MIIDNSLLHLEIPADLAQSSHDTKRQYFRKKIVDTFLNEAPGTGKGELRSRYRYNVETIGPDAYIYLYRPARLNKGFDFTVHADAISFRTRGNDQNMPSPQNIYADLGIKKSSHPSIYQQAHKLISDIFYCLPVNYAALPKMTAGVHNLEILLKSIKWLFIEQDITYWNWSGRHMFYGGLEETANAQTH